eukprot:TRINITY_DN33591_c0_g1_i1.p1 TRINITY_DN33591_c0_g1~~TRINITY_DN33591_c0_g1_i1.p1  ORF type:complete len:319 (-),score=28.26 TRINITY_DN33591_c0_g1_i1:428-1384(-)
MSVVIIAISLVIFLCSLIAYINTCFLGPCAGVFGNTFFAELWCTCLGFRDYCGHGRASSTLPSASSYCCSAAGAKGARKGTQRLIERFGSVTTHRGSQLARRATSVRTALVTHAPASALVVLEPLALIILRYGSLPVDSGVQIASQSIAVAATQTKEEPVCSDAAVQAMRCNTGASATQTLGRFAVASAATQTSGLGGIASAASSSGASSVVSAAPKAWPVPGRGAPSGKRGHSGFAPDLLVGDWVDEFKGLVRITSSFVADLDGNCEHKRVPRESGFLSFLTIRFIMSGSCRRTGKASRSISWASERTPWATWKRAA